MSVPIQITGPIYTETDLSRFPVEPWNTYSNILFLFIVLYFAYKTKLRFRDYPLIVTALPILLIGFIGGTVFHATRGDRMWLIMDFVPIFLLSFLASWVFWYQVTQRFFLSALLLCLPILISKLLRDYLYTERHLSISLGYSVLALGIIIPAILHSKSRTWKDVRLLIISFALFGAAITFRQIDCCLGARLFPMGTHFLWHIFGALSTFCLMNYIFLSSTPLARNAFTSITSELESENTAALP